ncbi:MAG: RNA-guided endonuclease IscB [Acholeplasmataceae bacterium]|nr:RNA-guided endonuclease IscB [Acholeplasmataceae bacterium]MDD4469250.1 RNA-guided endonuclease IscB [Acholeplasmataceae bacterium]
MRVFVKNLRNEPLMPCSERKAKLLLKQKKAKIIYYNPFTIQLLYTTGETMQEVNIGIDTGAKYIGIAITSEDKVFKKGEIELRNDISDNITSRSLFRRNRRSRKTRYRKARWLNRKRKKGWLPPSVQSKLDATFMWIDKFCSLIPNPKLSIEVGKFDITKMINPNIKGEEYQNGQCKNYYNIRYFVFDRDNYTCQVCKKKNKILQTHHIIYQSCGGTNRANNLITVCTDCHTSENHKDGGIFYKWMKEKKKVKQYKEATFMNIVRKRIYQKYPEARITYGSETTPKRKELGLEKTHYNDAITISMISNIKINPSEHFYIKQFRKKKRSLHESIPRKGIKTKNINQTRNNKNVKYRDGFYLNDKVKYNNIDCWIYGFAGGNKGRELVLRDINGMIIRMPERKSSVTVNNKKVQFICHNNNWQYTIVK